MTQVETPRLEPGTYTLRQVLDRVLEEVRKEPLRLDMRNYTAALRGEKKAWAGVFLTGMPACGTVACAAGWGHILITGTALTGMYTEGAVIFMEHFEGPEPLSRTEAGRKLMDIFMTTEPVGREPGSPHLVDWLEDRLAEFYAVFGADADRYTVEVK